MDVKTKLFRCDCNWPLHHLQVGVDSGLIEITVVNETLSFLDRLKACWLILRDGKYYYSQLYLHRDEVDSFASFVDEACKYVKLPTT